MVIADAYAVFDNSTVQIRANNQFNRVTAKRIRLGKVKISRVVLLCGTMNLRRGIPSQRAQDYRIDGERRRSILRRTDRNGACVPSAGLRSVDAGDTERT